LDATDFLVQSRFWSHDVDLSGFMLDAEGIMREGELMMGERSFVCWVMILLCHIRIFYVMICFS